MKNKLLNLFILTILSLGIVIVYNKLKLSNNSHFTVTSDTIIDPNSELAKYVTQEEVDSFSFRYWDIDIDEVKDNPLMENFRQILKTKNTTNILNFIKDNNLSIDEELHYGVTPLMYSSFYDDENTTKELIKLGADVHKKDKYSLSPLAYAIENNSTKTVKILLDGGVKFDDNERIQNYLNVPDYDNIKAIEIDNDKINIIYHYSYSEKIMNQKIR